MVPTEATRKVNTSPYRRRQVATKRGQNFSNSAPWILAGRAGPGGNTYSVMCMSLGPVGAPQS